MPYFMVIDVDGSAAKAKQLGGKAMVGPQDIEKLGRFAIISDPQGAVFAMFQPKSST
jgi:predicted enzyme related to lactoylglutathione lyase